MTQNNSPNSSISTESLPLRRSIQKPGNNSKIAKNVGLKLGVLMSLVSSINLVNLNQAAQATNLGKANFLFFKNGDSSFTPKRNKVTVLLPRIVGLVNSSLKSQSVFSKNHNELNTDSAGLKSNGQTSSLNQRPEAQTKEATQPVLQASAHSIYRVKPGDTVNKIASKYQVSSDELVKLNQIRNSNIIFVDQKLKIPTVKKLSSTKDSSLVQPESTKAQNNQQPSLLKPSLSLTSTRLPSNQDASSRLNSLPLTKSVSSEVKESKSSPDINRSSKVNLTQPKYQLESHLQPEDLISLTLPPLADSEEYLPSAFNGYIWPAQGALTSGYGWRWGRLHRGIDIAAPVGTPIYAAAAGEVISAGWDGGYGNSIKLEHLDGSVTVYAHNNRNLVSQGQRVKKGEQIAEMGSTGNSTGSHLHFEIHSRNKQSLDPLALLGSK